MNVRKRLEKNILPVRMVLKLKFQKFQFRHFMMILLIKETETNKKSELMVFIYNFFFRTGRQTWIFNE